MKYSIIDGKLTEFVENADSESVIEVVKYSEGEIPEDDNEAKQKLLDLSMTRKYSRFESYENYELLCLNLIYIEKNDYEQTPVYIILEKNKITFYTTIPEYVETLIKNIKHESVAKISCGVFLYYFMNKLIYGDLIHLESIESKLSSLEANAFSGCTDKTFSKQILNIKKHLMWISSYYEQFINLLSDLMQNLNGFFDSESIKRLNMIDSKLDRLHSKTVSLLNYASEIRNAYQAEVDLQLNKSMKVLTVISVIVLPLLLIASWYGMNFNMPEYACAYSYPILIIISFVAIAFLMVFFKKNKWF